jgi:hypothetical protein
MELTVGAGLLIVNVLAADVPPPGVGVNTVTDVVPAVAISAAVIWAVSCVWLTNVVGRLLPFQRTTDVMAKLLPVAVSVNATPPAVVLVGLIELSVGAGFVAVMLNVFAADVPPPGVGVNTVTEALPVAAMSLARIWAWSLVLLTNVVVRLLPFQRTTDEATKFVPVAVSVNAPLPTAAVVGRIELRVGTGLLWAAAGPTRATNAAAITVPRATHRQRAPAGRRSPFFRQRCGPLKILLTVGATMRRQGRTVNSAGCYFHGLDCCFMAGSATNMA